MQTTETGSPSPIVVHKQTYQRLPQLADFIYHNFPFVSQVAFLQMETIGNASLMFSTLIGAFVYQFFGPTAPIWGHLVFIVISVHSSVTTKRMIWTIRIIKVHI